MPDPNEDPYLVPKPDPNKAALSDPRVRSFLDTIGKSEGADYNTLVGGRRINDLSRHPNVVGLTTSAGPSTAFGRYQITGTTNRSKLGKYASLDYSPENQDIRAVELLRQTGALDAIQNDDQGRAVKLAGKEWASIPDSPLPGRKSSAFTSSQQKQDDPYLVPKSAIQQADDPYLVPKETAPPPSVTPPVTKQKSVTDALLKLTANVNKLTAPVVRKSLKSQVREQLNPPPGETVDTPQRAPGSPGYTPTPPTTRSVLGLPAPVSEIIGAGIEPRAQIREQIRKQVKREAPAPLHTWASEGGDKVPDETAISEEAQRRYEAQQWEEAHRTEIERQTNVIRKSIQKQGGVDKWMAEVASQGRAGLTRLATGAIKGGGRLTGLLTGGADVTDEGANQLRISAEAAQRAALAEGADRNAASQFAQNISAGLISSAPAMAAMAVGVPAPLAFAGQGGLEAAGGGEDVVKGTAVGGLTGAAFEIPGAGTGLKRVLTKAGTVGAGTTGVELAAGKSLWEAAQAGAANALMAGGGALLHGEGAKALETKTEPTERPTIPEEQQLALQKSEQQAIYDRLKRMPVAEPAADTAAAFTEPERNLQIQLERAQRNLAEYQRAGGQGTKAKAMAARWQSRVDGIQGEMDKIATGRQSEQTAKIESTRYSSTPRFDEWAENQTQQRLDQLEPEEIQKLGEQYRSEFGEEPPPPALREMPPLAASGSDVGYQYDRLKAGVSAKPNEAPMTEPVHHSNFQPRRVRNTETGNKGQFKTGKPTKAESEAIPNEPAPASTETRASATETLPQGAAQVAPSPQNEAGLSEGGNPSAIPPTESKASSSLSAAPKANIPEWLSEDIAQKVAEASTLRLSDSIEQLSAQRLTAKQVAEKIAKERNLNPRDVKDLVRAVRTDRNIPSMDDTTEFEKWVAGRTPVIEPKSEALPTQEKGGEVSSSSGAASVAGAAPESGDLKPRSFPQTLAATGREKGNDLYYQEVTDKASVDAANKRIAADPEAARRFAMEEGGSTKEKIATGLKLADQIISEAQNETDPVKAAEKHAQAIDLYSKLASDLTTAGQVVQSAQLAQRYTPGGAVIEATRAAKRGGGEDAEVSPDDANLASDLAAKHQKAEARIKELEGQLDAAKNIAPPTRASRTKIGIKLEPFKARLDKTAEEALARIAERTAKAKLGLTGAKNERGAAANPAGVALDIADYAIVGAAKIAKGGLNFAQWSAEMVNNLGDDIKPHLNAIFKASKQHLDEQRKVFKEESAQRGAEKQLTKQGEVPTLGRIQQLRAEKAKLQVERRQARIDLERHFKAIEDAEKSKALQITTGVLRDNLLSVAGFMRILGGMGAKQASDTLARFGEGAIDTAEVRTAQLAGKSIPRTSVGPSFGGLFHTIKYAKNEGLPGIKNILRGKGSDIMPSHSGPTGNPYLDAALTPMSRLYGSKEQVIRSWAYPQEQYSQALIMAKNDALDGLIRRGEIKARTQEYLDGKGSFDGARNKQYAESFARRAAKYETDSKRIIPSYEDIRRDEIKTSPKELIDSMAQQYADKQVYAEPSRVSNFVGGVKNQAAKVGMGKVFELAQADILPFVKRPANSIADAVYTYTGARIPVDAYKAINSKFSPTERASLHQAITRGGAGYGIFALGYLLAGQGLMTPSNDGKSKNIKEAADYKPGALHIGDRYYQMQNVPFFGWLLAAGATARVKGFKSVPGAVAIMIEEHPLLRGLKEAVDSAKEGIQMAQGKLSPGGFAQKQGGKLLARGVPSLLNTVAEASDSKQRDTKSLLGPAEARIPGVRQTLPVKKDVLGRDESKSRLSPIDPFKSSADSGTPGTAELIRLGVDIAPLQEETKGTHPKRVIPSALETFRQANPRALAAIDRMVKTIGYQKASDDTKRELLKKVIDGVRAPYEKLRVPIGKRSIATG